jgi:hypothetical protein
MRKLNLERVLMVKKIKNKMKRRKMRIWMRLKKVKIRNAF